MSACQLRIPIYKWSVQLFASAFLWSAFPLLSQTSQITHFVAPQYPPLARQVTISGQVVLKAKIDPSGKLSNLEVDSSAHPMLTQSATAAVKEWEFDLGRVERTALIQVVYGFSGITRRTDPKTTVRADFDQLFVRVFITTDAYPTGHYDTVDPPQPATQRQK